MTDLLEVARKEAVAILASAITDGAIAEPILRTSTGEVAYDSAGLKTPVRKDLARKEAGTWVSANVDAPGVRSLSPLQMHWDQTMWVRLQSITWDYVRFSVGRASHETSPGPLRSWFLRWFDAEEQNQATNEGLFGVVHFVSDPVLRDGRFEVIVDFGSAPIAAFEDLLRCFAELGFTECDIS